MFLICLTVYCLIVIGIKKNYNLIMNKIINMQTDFLLINSEIQIYTKITLLFHMHTLLRCQIVDWGPRVDFFRKIFVVISNIISDHLNFVFSNLIFSSTWAVSSSKLFWLFVCPLSVFLSVLWTFNIFDISSRIIGPI